MKKILMLALAAAMCLSLAACGEKAPADDGKGGGSDVSTSGSGAGSSSTPDEGDKSEPGAQVTALKLGESIDNDKFVMTFDSVEMVDEYSYPTGEYSTTSLYVEDGYKLLILKGSFENKWTGAITESAIVRTVVVNDSYTVDGFDVRMNFLRSKNFEIDAYTDQEYVIYINVPEKLAEQFETATFTVGFNDDMSVPTTVWGIDGSKTVEVDNQYSITSGLASGGAGAGGETAEQPSAKPIAIGETITTKDYEFTLTNVELTYEVLPPNTKSVYSSYVAESGKVYIDVAGDLKNTMKRDIRIDELHSATVLYDGEYPYDGFAAVEKDNSFDWVGSYVAATPLETCGTHIIIECPEEVDTSGKSIMVTLDLGGELYEYKLR